MSATTPEHTPEPTLGWSLAVLLRRWHEHVEQALADLPHGSRGFHVLGTIAAGEPPTQAVLAERLLIDRSVMTYLLDDLEAADLVRRRVDPKDRRVRRVCPTDHGRSVLRRAEELVAHVEERLLGALPEEQRELFRASAGIAAAAIQRSAPETDPCAAVLQVTTSSSPSARPSPHHA
ncbi:MarR family winged helix-turn-helix transcriptional regulator [Nocardiopsis sp. MG754419]|uniref:MarR family winged helix-turn-helix transcriptional regulator n=1 Tax=Nocardiopsis sp. MG754419 TaxID=2259865 RepID=UPI001BA67ABC|nr:MarR family winged helix-turn-helix transcriptional regulator [Nocardiopsis sp. MG754419]MBR8745387.1 MarR family transcriptional regulator [Nocardiopsis sp. MG754419]